MWIIIFLLMLIMSVGGAVYLVRGIHRFSFLQKLCESRPKLSWIAAIGLLALTGVFLFVNVWALIIVLIHLFVFWLGCDIVAWFVKRVRGSAPKKNYAGAAAVCITALYLGMGWFLAHHVFVTDYQLTTTKNLGQDYYRIALVADSHLGITLDGEQFAEQMERVNAERPDAVVIAGDFVDDDSCRSDMVRACQALGEMNAKYGVYFIFGNHDKGYYEGYRDFKTEDLRQELAKNGVTILEDESALAGNVRIIGRQDKSEEQRGGSREEMSSLMAEADSSQYTVVLDHQPNAYDEEAQSGADLVLSGHTHGGHIFPAGQIGLAIGANDRVYGYEKRLNTDFIVTSGISGWAIPFKTGTFSEYVIIDINSTH